MQNRITKKAFAAVNCKLASHLAHEWGSVREWSLSRDYCARLLSRSSTKRLHDSRSYVIRKNYYAKKVFDSMEKMKTRRAGAFAKVVVMLSTPMSFSPSNPSFLSSVHSLMMGSYAEETGKLWNGKRVFLILNFHGRYLAAKASIAFRIQKQNLQVFIVFHKVMRKRFCLS